jgi:hypothetical protein
MVRKPTRLFTVTSGEQWLRRVHAELGNGVFNLTMQVGNLADAVVRRGMELFRDRVLPEVRDL